MPELRDAVWCARPRLRGSAENGLRHMSEPPFARRGVPQASRGRRHRQRPSRVRTGRARSGRRETRVCPSVCRSCADSSTGGPDRRGYAIGAAGRPRGAVAEKPGSVPTCRSFVTIRPQRGAGRPGAPPGSRGRARRRGVRGRVARRARDRPAERRAAHRAHGPRQVHHAEGEPLRDACRSAPSERRDMAPVKKPP